MPFCTNCGHDNPEASNFCANCGTPLRESNARESRPSDSDSTAGETVLEPPITADSPAEMTQVPSDTTRTMPAMTGEDRDPDALSEEEVAAVKALPRGSALLIVKRGSNAGSRFLLNTDQATAGRHQDSDIFLDDISVSRKHVVFARTPEGTTVRDVGSLNGTYVNRVLIEDDYLLHHGDEVQIGKYRLVYFASTQGL